MDSNITLEKKKGRKIVFAVITAAVLIFTFLAECSQTSVTAEAAAKKLNVTEQTLVIGQTLNLKLSGVANKKVKWTSSNSRTASVSKGKVIARSRGSAKITATYKKKRWFCTIHVVGTELEYYDFYRTSADGGNFVDHYYDSDPDDGVYFVIYSGCAEYNRGISCGDSAEDVIDAFGDSYTYVEVSRDTNRFDDEFDEIDEEPVYAILYEYGDEESDDAVSKTFYFDETNTLVLIIWW